MSASIKDVCKNGAGGGAALGEAGQGDNKTITLPLKEYDDLKMSLSKTNNRIIHLNRTIDTIEGKQPAPIYGMCRINGKDVEPVVAPVAKSVAAPKGSLIDKNAKIYIQFSELTGPNNAST
jgi:predicted transcriptional regulator